MRWVAVTVASLVVAGFGVLGYHRTLPSCFQSTDAQSGNPYLENNNPYLPHDDDPVVYQRTGAGFFNCR